MKAHLIISENKANNELVLEILLNRLAKGSKEFRKSNNCVSVPQHYEFQDWDQIFFNGKELIQLLTEFPADMVTSLKPIHKPRVIFTDKDLTDSIYGGRYFDFQVFKIPKEIDSKTGKMVKEPHYKACNALASHVYFRIMLHFVHKSAWNDRSKATLLNYYRKHAVLQQNKFITSIANQKTAVNEQ